MTIGRIEILLLGLLMCCAGRLAAADELSALMAALADVQQVEVDYEEEKHLALLDLPLLQRGHLSYQAPDTFIRSLEAPVGGRFEIRGQQVIVETGNRRQQKDLRSLPLVQAFVASFGAVLAGDLRQLQRYYQVDFKGSSAAWKLRLQPNHPDLAAYVSEIRLWGAGAKIEGMEINERNGDWSRMKILHEN